jgi:hypothetical protein
VEIVEGGLDVGEAELGPGGSKARNLLNGITLRAREGFTNVITANPPEPC